METTSTSTLILVWSAMVVVQMGFGAYGVIVTKFAKDNKADPLVFCLLRDGFCFPVLFLAGYIAEKRILIPNWRELVLLAALGVIGMFGNQILYILGIYFTSADVASMFQPIAPVWTCVLVVIFRIEPMPNIKTLRGVAKVIGVLCAVAGAIITTIGKQSKHETKAENDNSSGTETLGYIALICNTLCLSVYVILQKKYVFNVPTSRFRHLPIGLTAWSYLFGFITMAIASLYYVNKPEKFRSITSATVYPLIYAVFITSALCYMLITWSNMLVSSSVVTAFWPLQVLFCVILAYFILGETLGMLEILGGLVMIVALLAVVWSNYQDEKHNQSITLEVNDDKDAFIT